MFIINPYRYVVAGGGGSISFVGSLTPVGADNGGSVTLTFSNLVDAAGNPATLLENDLVICVYVGTIGSNQDMSTSSSGWTEAVDIYADGAFDTNLGVFYKKMSSSPDANFVCTGSGGSAVATIGVAMAFRGVDTATPLDVAVQTATGTGTGQPNPPSITPSTAGSWIVVVGGAAAATGSAFTNPGDLSSTTNHFRSANHPENNDGMIGIGIKTDWSSGAFDPGTWGGGSNTANDSWAAASLALRSA